MFMRKLLILIVLVCFPLSTFAKDRPELFGWQLPIPKPFKFKPAKRWLAIVDGIYDVKVHLTIDKKGKIKKITPETVQDLAYVDYFRDNLMSVKFEAAKKDGKKVAFLLPCILRFEKKVIFPEVYFPIDTARKIFNRALYFSAFDSIQVEFAKLDFFPTYYCDLEPNDSLTANPFILFKVNIDETGNPVEIKKISSTYSQYDVQLQSAIQWAKFKPAFIDNQPVASENYLIVSFFPYVNYPTIPWYPSNKDGDSYYHNLQLKLIPDTVGNLQEPIPAFISPDNFLSASRNISKDSVLILFSVDTSGKAKISRFSKMKKRNRKPIFQMIKNKRFYPALDYSGHPVETKVLANFILQNSGYIRIKILKD